MLSLDLVRLSRTGVCTTAILMTNDRDFANAVSTAQDFGVRVLLATPNKHQIADEFKQIADEVIEIPKDTLRKMCPSRAPGRP